MNFFLRMEAAGSSETLMSVYQITRRYVSYDTPNIYRLQNLISLRLFLKLTETFCSAHW